MRISIFGLGYVGAVTAACLARDGHHVIGVDVNAEKVAGVAAGRSPIVEEGLDGLLARAVADGRVEAITDARAAIGASDVSMITVGTPPLATASPTSSSSCVCAPRSRRRSRPSARPMWWS